MSIETLGFLVIAAVLILAEFASGPLVARKFGLAPHEIHRSHSLSR